jgi:UDP-glucose 4-epimerase
MDVLITGGAGFIGSVTAAALERAGHTPVVLDSLVKGRRELVGDRTFYQGDIADRSLLEQILGSHDIACTIHCAALTVVPESVREPARYYRENVVKTLALVETLVELGSPRVVFSSSGSVYATAPGFEVRESDRTAPTSPYSRTKEIVDAMLADLSAATDLRAVSLRYFNPIGADPRLTAGPYESEPAGVLNRLVGAARGELPPFAITGTDFPTRDGTGIRDYVHVWDVALAHVAAVERFDDALAGGTSAVLNIGTGAGTTVRELVAAFTRVFGPVPVVETERRPGDAPGWYANVDLAGKRLDWRAASSLDDAIASALAWADVRGQVLGHG